MCGNGRDRKSSSFFVQHVGVMVKTREVRWGSGAGVIGSNLGT